MSTYHEPDTNSSISRVIANIPAALWFGSLIPSIQKRLLFSATVRNRVHGGGGVHACLRSAQSLSWHGMGTGTQRRPLPRLRERRSRGNALSCRIPPSFDSPFKVAHYRSLSMRCRGRACPACVRNHRFTRTQSVARIASREDSSRFASIFQKFPSAIESGCG
jgi:hypothetical protein